MPVICTAAVFTFNGLTPGLYTRRILPRSLFGGDDIAIATRMYLRTWGSSLPAIGVASAEMGIMGDPLVDDSNGIHRFPIAPFFSGSNLNVSTQELSVMPNEDLYAYVRVNGASTPAALYLAHLSFVFDIKRAVEVLDFHQLPKTPIRTTHLDA